MKKKINSFFVHLELIMVALFVLIPILWIVLSSFNPGDSLASSSLIPKKLTLYNYARLFKETNYPVWFKNSFLISTMNAAVSVVLIMITAWIVSRFHFKGRRSGLIGLLLLSMFPNFLSMTALYTLYLTLGLLNHPLALVIIYSAGAIPYNVWLVKGYLDGISKEIDEAAYIDGCSYFSTFLKIILPMSKPIITYCAVSQFMLPWMDFIMPSLLLSTDNDNTTVAIGLYNMISGKENDKFTMFAAGAILIAVPITILFILFQKYLVQGVAAGANKG
ncbi:Maltose transport system permease protein MalG [Caprobacter fermentans]|uniref:Maltose transport system permease protein MalG n=1 Tax=Caproicibacter fermentans TaxID=2576756 RepID=A0A6N8I3K2_9FIRM|nr:sugar ABC transporter permease [Caproicibacter fermentans]MVB12505.1 Maltose transport system permease protein MalG [Caproicibacter fermentans]OCN03077.1 sugar ABC transporter permease [Clostridium sp. W14A]